jgi:AcrR family transcriptional regulator
MKDKKAKRKEVLEAMMQQEIYDVAMQLLATKPVDEITMEEVASLTGVSRPTLYNYFNGKDGLIEFTGLRIAEALISSLEENLNTPVTPKEKLLNFITFFLKYFHNRGTVLAVLQSYKTQGSNSTKSKEIRTRIRQLFKELLEEGVHSGDFNSSDYSLQMHLIFGCLSSIIQISQFEATDYKPEDMAKKVFLLIQNGIGA